MEFQMMFLLLVVGSSPVLACSGIKNQDFRPNKESKKQQDENQINTLGKASILAIPNNHCFQTKVKMTGNQLEIDQKERASIHSYLDCQRKCDEIDSCSLFAFDSQNTNCELYANIYKKDISENFVTGRKKCSDDEPYSSHPIDPCKPEKVSIIDNDINSFTDYVQHRSCRISLKAIVDSNNKFLKELYTTLKSSHKGNLIMSQYSISLFMLLVLRGSGGETKKQISKCLQYPELEYQITDGFNFADTYMKEKKDVEIFTENRVYISEDYEISDEFQDTIQTAVRSTLAVPIDFSNGLRAKATIDRWIARATNNQIEKLVDSELPADTKMIVANVIYFKGLWEHQFQEAVTSNQPFYLNDGTVVKAQTMHLSASFRIANVPKLDAQALELPYKGKLASMIIFSPNQMQGLNDLENNLKNFDFNSIEFGAESIIDIYIPKFKIESTLDLERPLKSLGLRDLFDAGQANLTGISPQNDLYVSSVYQKAAIEVNEFGTVASAANAMKFEMKSIRPEFKVDHPFFYVIKDIPTGLILFAGCVVDPSRSN